MTKQDLRDQIDVLDRQLLALLKERFELCRAIKSFKETIEDPERETELALLWQQEALQLGIAPDFAHQLLQYILTEAKQIQANDTSTIA